jgi:hypothetical protein
MKDMPKTELFNTFAIKGMELRDYFAAKAMQGIVDSSVDAGLETTQIADSAYRIADAMMKARTE